MLAAESALLSAETLVEASALLSAGLLVEAKAVGVELDATKRIKECCDKAHDWGNPSAELDSPVVVTVIAGFFTISNISNLQSSGIKVVWEHRLGDLEVLL